MCYSRNCRCCNRSRGCNSANSLNTCNCSRQQNTCSSNNCPNNSSRNNTFPENYLYGYAYTPNQCMDKTFCPETGLAHGTIFPELVSPYSPGQSIDFINYLRSGGM